MQRPDSPQKSFFSGDEPLRLINTSFSVLSIRHPREAAISSAASASSQCDGLSIRAPFEASAAAATARSITLLDGGAATEPLSLEGFTDLFIYSSCRLFGRLKTTDD